MKVSPREQIILVVAVVLVVSLLAWRFGLGDALDELRQERRDVARLRDQAEDFRRDLRRYRAIADEYDRYANFSLQGQEGDPADVFSNFVADTIQELNLTRAPDIDPTRDEEIEGVPNYRQILLPVNITLRLDDLKRLLEAFAAQRILIRGLEIRALGTNGESDLEVKLTLSRFIRADDLEQARAEAEAEDAADSGTSGARRADEEVAQ